MGADVAGAWRHWCRRPAEAGCVVLLLIVGIAANAVVFSIVERLLISPLAVGRSETLVSLGRQSYPNYLSLVDRLDGVDGVAAFVNRRLTLTAEGREPVRGAFVTRNYFMVLGVELLQGRGFAAADGTRTAVISEYFWRAAWGADPEVVGRTLWLSDLAVQVVGVVPGNFQGTTLEYVPHVWVPIDLQTEVRPGLVDLREDRRNPWVTVIARRMEETSLSALKVTAARLAAALASEYPGDNAGWSVDVVPLARAALPVERRRTFVLVLSLLQLAAVSVFVVGVANIAIMALASMESRRRELGVRLACGARVRRLVGLETIRHGMLGVAGGGCGVAAAWMGLEVLTRAGVIPPTEIGAITVVGVVVLTVAVPLAVGSLSTLDVRRWERESVGRTMEGRGGGASGVMVMHAVVAAQVAVSLGVACGALLLVEDLRRKVAIDNGFDEAGVVRISLSFPAEYTKASTRYFRRAVVSEASAVPGIDAAGWGVSIPFDGVTFLADVSADERPEERVEVITNYVDPGFFSALGIPLIRGGGWSGDGGGRSTEVVVSKALATRFWPDGEVVGRRLRTWDDGAVFEVVGVVGNTRYRSLDGAVELVVYFPPNDAFVTGHLVVSTGHIGGVGALRERIGSLDDRVLVRDVRGMEEILEAMFWRDRLVTAGVGGFGVLALTLMGLGLGGTATRLVGLRKREIGVRMALGARRRDVFMLVMGENGFVVASGILAGTGLALGGWRLLLSRVPELDLVGMAGAVGEAVIVVMMVEVLAVAFPAWRAATVDPATVLRTEQGGAG